MPPQNSEETGAPTDDCAERSQDVESITSSMNNIVENHDFSKGLHPWRANCCHGYVASGEFAWLDGIAPKTGDSYAVVTSRTESWQLLEQDITERVTMGSPHYVLAYVRVQGCVEGLAEVQATLKLENSDSDTKYLTIGRNAVTNYHWEKLQGVFTLETIPKRVAIFLEGPPPGVDVLVDSVVVSCPSAMQPEEIIRHVHGEGNIIQNPCFEYGLSGWSAKWCNVAVNNSISNGKIKPFHGSAFASVTDRHRSWDGIQQDITSRVQRKLAYEASAVVRIVGNDSATVRASLWVKTAHGREQFITVASLEEVTDKQWVRLKGRFLLHSVSSQVVIYIEGPPMGTDILVNSLVVERAKKPPSSPLPQIESVLYGVNIIDNSNLNQGLNGWSTLGRCTLSVCHGAPDVLPAVAREHLRPHEPLSGLYILTTNRSESWMGPSKTITDKLKLHVTYQFAAWVRVDSGASSPQVVKICVEVDGLWSNGGQMLAVAERWSAMAGSFRIEKQPLKVTIYVVGPSPGVNLMVAGLCMFPVDRKARFKHLKEKTDEVRKQDIVLKFDGVESSELSSVSVKVTQIKNSFPLGSCLNRAKIDNEEFVDFFLKNFNWAVFENETKWSHNEQEQGTETYREADDLLDFCTRHGIETRGHCVFWEAEKYTQPWVLSLNHDDLMTAVQNRLTSVLTRYRGKFKHWDVNNEMLHGTIYQDRLGKDIRAYMYKEARRLDPSATLFVNDYCVVDGTDYRSLPEVYIQQILELQEQGAPIEGIGTQGHFTHPIGPIICASLDKLGTLGLPIWFTELDIVAENEHNRADDLEVVLREAYAHPAVEGIMLWVFWELFTYRDNSHLVDAEGEVNEAGKRLLALKQEWLSHADGSLGANGEFRFRGYEGTYTVEVATPEGKSSKSFVVKKGDSPVVLIINL